MPKNRDRFISADRKRQILIADDELINREILGEILRSEYEVLYAADGQETLEMMREHSSTLSLVLLDILMPLMSGLDVLKAIREDAVLSHIPIIVMTAERDTEVESLKLGATDFIPKPYPEIDVIHARVLRTIELFEDRSIIQSTERDELTGLYNKEFFFRYAEEYDQYHPDTDMDALLVDINHFRMINERYGRAHGDELLRRIAKKLQEAIRETGGIVCRWESDSFLAYCPHRDSYDAILESASVRLADDDTYENRVHLRMGVYYCADKSIDVERRFDRAKMAADTIRGSFSRSIGIYDNDLHKRQLYAEQLIESFPAAISEKQFKVYYQPKFNVQHDTPILSSAEALVRWVHPELGMISPGVFIPLFEENGLIQKLDTYVWCETARQIREWKDRLGSSIPVSVNVSRVDLYDPKLPEVMRGIIQAENLSPDDILLEVTESAYTEDTAQIIATVEALRKEGFRIEMDDFGTGYSSLNMISSLPVDVMKLDLQFIRSAFREGGNTHMIEVIIGISDYLSVPVVAEGVETAEQLYVLKNLGCEIVQGYYFSKPVPAEEFETFLLQKMEAERAQESAADSDAPSSRTEQLARSAKLDLLREAEQQSEQSAPLPPEEEAPAVRAGIPLKAATIVFALLAFIAALALLISDIAVTRGYRRMESASDRYISAQMATSDMESGSDYLTDKVRIFVVTGEIEYLNDFIEEVEVAKRRDNAVTRLESLLDGYDASAIANLNTALSLSNELVVVEYRAMRLMLEATGYDLSQVPAQIAEIELTPEELAMSAAELKDRAQTLVFDNSYMHYKDRIRENVSLCTQALIRSSRQELEQASASFALLVKIQTAMTIVFFLIVLGILCVITLMVRRPLTHMVRKMQQQQQIPPRGVEELRFVTRIYNRILQENQSVREKLSHEASHDALTGLFNRGAYDLLMENADKEHMALILIDIDDFKSVNDTYGHAVGDKVLKRIADLMRANFRSVDILCRFGGDEFVVVMTRVSSSLSQLVLSKISHINAVLQQPEDDLPPVSLSVGVAFSDRENPQGDIFQDADTALYRVKEAGRKGCRIYGAAPAK